MLNKIPKRQFQKDISFVFVLARYNIIREKRQKLGFSEFLLLHALNQKTVLLFELKRYKSSSLVRVEPHTLYGNNEAIGYKC